MSQGTTTRSKTLAQKADKPLRSETPGAQAPSSAGTRVTRSSTQEPTNKADQQSRYSDAWHHLSTIGALAKAEACTPATLAKALFMITAIHKVPPNVAKTIHALSTIAENMDTHCAGCTRTDFLTDMLKVHHNDIQSGLEDKLDEINQTLEEKLPRSEENPSTAGAIEEAVKSLNRIATEFEGMFAKATDSTTELAKTARSYKEALLSNPTSSQSMQTRDGLEVGINAAKDRRDRQVLIEIPETQLFSFSLDVIQEKAENAIKQVSDPPPPPDTSIIYISRARKPGIIINFGSKEAAEWLRHPDVSHMFTAHFITGSNVKLRQYTIMLPRVPITFDPEEDRDLREIEEANGLADKAIVKAKWIKPVYRRRPDQRVAHASLLLTDVNAANRCIKDGLRICGTRVYPTKLKQEPAQCMKCRGWGHFASECSQTNSTCGTCGGEHRTVDCSEEGKKYCVSCKSDTHASWDRGCPEFIKRCSWYDDKHPDNMLRFFPTDETWTQEARPPRLPFTERFPARFAVGSLPPHNRNERDLPTRPIERPPKRPRNKGKWPAGQTTLDGFFPSSQGRREDNSITREEEREEGEVSDMFHSFERPDYAEFANAHTYSGWD